MNDKKPDPWKDGTKDSSCPATVIPDLTKDGLWKYYKSWAKEQNQPTYTNNPKIANEAAKLFVQNNGYDYWEAFLTICILSQLGYPTSHTR
jgi:hypothetical protein